MDSGNSVSSSGGDDEYDSRAAVPFNPFANTLQMPSFNSPWLTTNNSFVPQQLQHETTARVAENINTNEIRPQQSTRNPKKRTRASRRAPTTVLNTDTSNFRAMVQQFTGVPSTPFHDNNTNNNINSGININKRSRFSDIFGTTSNGSAYSPFLRPFVSKPTPLASSSSINNISLLSTVNTDEEARKFSSNDFDTPNPIGMDSHSLLLQNNTSFPVSSSSFGNYMMIPTTSTERVNYYNNNSSLAEIGGLNDEQFGGLLRHGNEHVSVTGLPNLVSTEQKDNQIQNEGAVRDHNNNYNGDDKHR